jgi:hypothetical protein
MATLPITDIDHLENYVGHAYLWRIPVTILSVDATRTMEKRQSITKTVIWMIVCIWMDHTESLATIYLYL